MAGSGALPMLASMGLGPLTWRTDLMAAPPRNRPAELGIRSKELQEQGLL